jgi:anti-sigma B factor antagonist
VAAQRFFVRGDIDIANASQLGSELEALVGTGDGDLILDCTGLTYLGSAGVSVIVTTQKTLAARGNELRVANVHGIAARVVDVLDLIEVLHVNEPAPGETGLIA